MLIPNPKPQIVTTGGHFSTAFWFPAYGRTIHLDTYKGFKLYELMMRELMPFLSFCSNNAVGEPLRKDSSSGIDEQLEGTLVCSITTIRFLRQALEKLKQINYNELQKETSPWVRQEVLFRFLAELKTRAVSYSRWRREAGDDLDNMISEYTSHRKRKAQLLQDTSGKKQATDPAVVEAEAIEESDSDSSPPEDSEDDAIMGGKACSGRRWNSEDSEEEMEFSGDDLSD